MTKEAGRRAVQARTGAPAGYAEAVALRVRMRAWARARIRPCASGVPLCRLPKKRSSTIALSPA